MLEQLKQILKEMFDIDSATITEDTDLALDLGLSSFQLMSLVTRAEDEFGIEIDDRDLLDMHTVGDVLKYIERVG